MAEKTEKATPKKLRDARKKGQVAKAQDLPSAFTFIVSIWALLALSGFFFQHLGGYLVSIFRLIPDSNLLVMLPQIFADSITVMLLTSIPILLIVAFIGVLVTFLTVGPLFTFEVFKFDIKKFNPVENLKAKFKLKTLVELVKSLLKIGIASYIIYDVMLKSLPVLIKTISMPMGGALLVLSAFLVEVLVKIGLFFIFVAVADYAYQKYNFSNEMKMEKFEVKQEYKNTEGDPHIKSKRRQIAQELAYQEGPANTIRKSQAVVTNPTHLAIAIMYKKEFDLAPFIVAKGQDMLAERMVKLAQQYNVPVVRNISLAHKLWEDGEVYEFVPENTYEAVAEIIRWLAALEAGEDETYQENRELE